jgi:septum site-determining protein MinC
MMADKTGAKVVIFDIDPEFEKEWVKSGQDGKSFGQNNEEITLFDARGAEKSEVEAETDGDARMATGSEKVGNKTGNAGDIAGTDKVRGETDKAAEVAPIAVSGGSDGDGKGDGKDDDSRDDAGKDDDSGMEEVRRKRMIGNPDDKESAVKRTVKKYFFTDLDECMTKFHRGTMRSGKLISYEGNVVVIGDVNPGAEVEATGNIVIVGTLRGTVHAGASGNKDATVVALSMTPAQLRIADLVTRRPDAAKSGKGNNRPNYIPEIAYIKDDAIHIEAFLTHTKF